MKVHTAKIQKKGWHFYSTDIPLYAIEDYAEVCALIRPQHQEEGKALIPDCAFIFAQSATYLFAINIALDEEGWYHFGYDLYEHDGGCSCYPSARNDDRKKSTTLKGCIVNALEYVRAMRPYGGQPPYPLYVSTADDALRKITSSVARQLTIFDFLN